MGKRVWSAGLTGALLFGALGAQAQTPGTVRIVAGGGVGSCSAFGANGCRAVATSLQFTGITGLALDGKGNLFVEQISSVATVSPAGIAHVVQFAPLTLPNGSSPFSFGSVGFEPNGELTVDSSGRLAGVITDFFIVGIAQDGSLTGLAGFGSVPPQATPQTSSGLINDSVNELQFLGPVRGLAAGPNGELYVATGGMILALNADGLARLIAGGGTETGDGGLAQYAMIDPGALAVGGQGEMFFVDLDQSHASGPQRVREVDSSGIITTVAGGGSPSDGLGDGLPATKAQLNAVGGLAADSAGDLFIADAGSANDPVDRVREVDAHGVIRTVAGGGSKGTGVGGSVATQIALQGPLSFTIDGAGNLFVADADLLLEVYSVAAPGLVAGRPLSPKAVGIAEAGHDGDVNGDGRITTADAVLALRIALGLAQGTPAEVQAAEVTSGNAVTVADVTVILRYAIGLTDRFPVEG